MQPKPEEIKTTTGGEWIVTTTPSGFIAVAQLPTRKVIAIFGQETDENANEHLANAALFAVSKNMLDALIAIQETILDPGAEEIDINVTNEMISTILSKLANEAGEEL
jgi:hypothetical protein